MLIVELYRLVPYKEGRYVQFHPFNMPNVKLRKIEVVGTVMNVKRNVNNLFLTSKARTVRDVSSKFMRYARRQTRT